MPCEDAKLNLSLLADGESEAGAHAGLFAHLERCEGCREFLAEALSVRRAVRRDRDALLAEADEMLPARLPRPAAAPSPAVLERLLPRERPGRALALALGLAVVVLAAGVVIGLGLPRDGVGGATAPPVEGASAPGDAGVNVVYVCAMPEYAVVAEPLADPAR